MTTKPRHLLLLTTNHPFTYNGGETMFVAPELPHLAAAFGEGGMTVVPLHDEGDRLAVPEGVTVDQTLARSWRRRRPLAYIQAPIWPGFLPEFATGLRRGGIVGAFRVWRWAAIAQVVWDWLSRHKRIDQPLLFYTYWRGGQTLATARWSSAHPSCATVTRVHRYELYEEAFSPPFQPWTEVYRHLSRVFPIAAHGRDYLVEHGVPAEKLTVARLGVPAVEQRTEASTDGVLRIVSCSTLTKVKRVPFTAQTICALSRLVPNHRIEWHHFGDGPEQAAVRAALADAPVNLLTRLHGHVANSVVLDHYRKQRVDLFVLLSSSEGLPVAIQEALAAGIPVVACDVGGVAEAVWRSGDNGALLAADVDVADAAATMFDLLVKTSQAQRNARRDAAAQTWATLFEAPKNHAALARSLRDSID